ncbi:hypothetical protein ACQP1U_00185 [Actinomycetota bacterium]
MFKTKSERKQDAAAKHAQLAAENAREAAQARRDEAQAAMKEQADKARETVAPKVEAAKEAMAPKVEAAREFAAPKVVAGKNKFAEDVLPGVVKALAAAVSASAAAKARAQQKASDVDASALADLLKERGEEARGAAYEAKGRSADALAVLRGEAVAKPKRSGGQGLILLGIGAAAAAAYAAWKNSQPKSDPWAVPADNPYGKGLVDTEHIGKQSVGDRLHEAADTAKAKAAEAKDAVAAKVEDSKDTVQHKVAERRAGQVDESDTAVAAGVGAAAAASGTDSYTPRRGAGVEVEGDSYDRDVETRLGDDFGGTQVSNAPADNGDSWGGIEVTTLEELGQAPGQADDAPREALSDEEAARRDEERRNEGDAGRF